MSPRFFAVVPAAGGGLRMLADRPKQYLPCAGKTVLEHALGRLLAWPRCRRLAVALAAGDERFARLPVARDARIARCLGGGSRAASVLAGLQALAGAARARDWVLVHDGARPCLELADLERLVAELGEDPVGGLLALQVSETVKQSAAPGRVTGTLERGRLWLAQTPQMFRYGLLRDALRRALAAGQEASDEAAAVERAGFQPRLVAGSASNLKITRPQDLALAEFWLARQAAAGRAAPGPG